MGATDEQRRSGEQQDDSDVLNLLRIRWILTLSGLVALAIGLFGVFRPFLVPLLWASILVVTTWPVYRRVLRFTGDRTALAALIMTLIQTLVVIAAVVPMLFAARDEMQAFSQYLQQVLHSGAPILPESISQLPVVGPLIVEQLELLRGENGKIVSLVGSYQGTLLEVATFAAKGLFGALAGIVMCLFVVYFFYLHGASLSRQLASGLHRIGGPRFDRLLETVRSTVRGALYGVVATALAQGILAGIGYYVAGAPTPLLLGLATVVMSLIPFGTPAVYIPVALYVAVQDSWFYGLGLLVWGVAVVSTIDNFLRPYFISQATRMPILLVFIGVIGGLISFGLVGIFVGPVLIAIAQALWIEWTDCPSDQDVINSQQ